MPDGGSIDIAGLFGQLGVVGVLVWYLWYNTSVAEPKKDQHFRDQFDRIAESHIKSNEKICASFEQCIREERAARRQDIDDIKALFEISKRQ